MTINTDTLAIILVSASLLVIAMLIHYVVRVGQRYDQLCIAGLLAASFGLQQSGRALDAPGNLFPALSLGFALLCIALTIWTEGLRRARKPR